MCQRAIPMARYFWCLPRSILDLTVHLEAAIDKCEDVANIIERITIKHA